MSALSELQGTDFWPHSINNKDIVGNFQFNTRKFALLIIAADGKISDEEIEQFNYIFDESYNRFTIRSEVMSVLDGDFRENVTEVPDYMYALSEYDASNTAGLSAMVYKFLYFLGLNLVASDEDISDEETVVVSLHTSSIQDFLKARGIVVEDPALDSDTSNVDTATGDDPASIVSIKSEEHVLNADDLINELNSLIGLSTVKNDVSSLTNFIKVRNMRRDRGLPVTPMSFHLVFTGNPGTGKTTVARLLARIYKSLGLLSKGHLIEVDRSSLVAGYVGQTALKVREVAERAKGGVLFIDEAYTLSQSNSDNDYGKEAIETLLKFMEDHREDFVVIVAGYSERMQRFLESNPGLRSRFNKFVHFEDYGPEEMRDIFVKLVKDSGYDLTVEAKDIVYKMVRDRCDSKGQHFANARDARNLFENALARQADRVVNILRPSEKDLTTIIPADLPSSFAS